MTTFLPPTTEQLQAIMVRKLREAGVEVGEGSPYHDAVVDIASITSAQLRSMHRQTDILFPQRMTLTTTREHHSRLDVREGLEGGKDGE